MSHVWYILRLWSGTSAGGPGYTGEIDGPIILDDFVILLLA